MAHNYGIMLIVPNLKIHAHVAFKHVCVCVCVRACVRACVRVFRNTHLLISYSCRHFLNKDNLQICQMAPAAIYLVLS